MEKEPRFRDAGPLWIVMPSGMEISTRALRMRVLPRLNRVSLMKFWPVFSVSLP